MKRLTRTPATSGQQKLVTRMIVEVANCDVVQKALASLDREAAERLKGNASFIPALRELVVGNIARFSAALPDYTMAKAILGDDFIMPEEVTKARALKYSPTQLRRLAESLPSEEVLHELKRDGYALMPAPPKRMSLLDIRVLKNTLFCSKEGGWYSDMRHTFSREDKTSIGWLAIKKAPIANSTSKTWSDQLPHLPETDHVPNAAEFAWFLTTYFEVRSIRLFQNIFARTSSVDAFALRVSLGWHGYELFVDYNSWDDYALPFVGLASARKF